MLWVPAASAALAGDPVTRACKLGRVHSLPACHRGSGKRGKQQRVRWEEGRWLQPAWGKGDCRTPRERFIVTGAAREGGRKLGGPADPKQGGHGSRWGQGQAPWRPAPPGCNRPCLQARLPAALLCT